MATSSDHTALNIGSDSSEKNKISEDIKIQQLKDHFSEVSNIMQENIQKILERETNIEHIEKRSDLLTSRSGEFCANARRIQRKMWWQNIRMNIILGLILLIIVLIVYFVIKT